MSEQTRAIIEHREQGSTAEALATRFSAMADDLITRAFAVRGPFNHNTDENIVGIHVYSTNDTGSSGKGGDVLRAGDLDDRPSRPSVSFKLTRERKQIPHEQEGSKPHGPSPEEEEKSGRLGPLTGAYKFTEYKYNPAIGSDHVAEDSTWIENWGDTPALRPARGGSLVTASAATEAKLEAIREIVEAAEARHAAATKQARVLPGIRNWFRNKLPLSL